MMKPFKILPRLFAIFGLIMMFALSGWGDTEDNDNCSQIEQISEIHNQFGTYNWTETGQVQNNDPDYYYFTIPQNGTLSYSYTSTAATDLRVQIGGSCSTSMNRVVNNSTALPITTVSITAGDTVRMHIARRNGTPNYSLVLSFSPTVSTVGGRDFSLRKDIKLYGDVSVVGNTVLCQKSGTACVEPTSTTNSNASTNLEKAPLSYSTISFPTDVTGENVKYARLYWQGRKPATTASSSWSSTQQESAKTIGIRKGNSGVFTTLTADFADFSEIQSTNYVGIYSAGVDVLDFVKNGGSGIYSIDTDNFYTETGATNSKTPSDGLGAYGAWVLVVVYEDPASTKFKDIAVFDGYKIVSASGTASVEISVTGFYAPKAPATVDSKVYLFAGEGDKYIAGDEFYLRGGKQATYGAALGTFDSRIDVSGVRSPSLTNNNGIDIQTYNVGTATGGLGLITNEEKTAWMKFTTTQDTYFPSLAVFSTDLYVPEICYDYSFSQNNRFFPHDTSATAHIKGYLLNTEPLTASIMFRNKTAGSEAQNIKLYINDIDNTNQLQFYTDTTLALQKTLPNSFYYNPVPSADILKNTTDDLAFDWLTGTGTLGYNESIFSTFKLDPLVTGLIDVPLYMSIDYEYVIDSVNYPMTNIALDSRIQRCTAAPSAYNPVEWIFNVVDSGLNPGTISEGVTNVKYNLPTQVANRPVDIKVVSFDPVQLDRVKAISGMVSIEMIDVGGYLDTGSSCADPNSAITPRAWLALGDVDSNVTSATLTESLFNVGLNTGISASDYFKNVRENVAYRVGYNIADDNGSIKFDAISGNDGTRYHLVNFPDYGGQVCAVDMDGNPNSTDTVPQYCGNTGNSYASAMTGAETRACMECIYGLKTKSVCSRDNFAIRPEAFDIKITDPIGATVIPYDANISAGYLYQFDANATNHLNGNATSGYSAWFDGANPDQNVSLSWEPNGHVDTGCNDTTSPSLEFFFANGQITAQNRKHSNVGRYRLGMRDTMWTRVDQWPISHHSDATNWFQNTDDCAAGSNVPLYNAAGTYAANNVGCEISSNHNKLKAPAAIYSDYSLSFRPDYFDVSSIGMSTGTNFGVSAINQNVWTYMNNVNTDENMSVRYFGKIIAKGDDDGMLSNFVKDCYAEPINMNLNLTFPTTAGLPNWRYRLQELNASIPAIWRDSNAVIASPITNTSFNFLSIPESGFLKNQNGLIDMNLSINFDRNQTLPVDPISVGLGNLQVKCQTSDNCKSIANGSVNHLPDANLTTNSNVTFAYGRLLTKDIRVFGPIGFTANGWYEVFNLPTFNGTAYQPSKSGVNWFINGGHDDIGHGDSSVTRLISVSGTDSIVRNGADDNAGTDIFPFAAIAPTYNGKAHVDTAPWLWHAPNALIYSDPSAINPANAAGNDAACLTHPCFNVTVMPAIGATGSAKDTNEANKDSKRSTGGTGWRSTTDYAPAIR